MKSPSSYYNKMHRVGSWMTIAAIAIFFAVPLIFCLIYDIMPSMSEVFVAAGGLCAIFIPMSIAETISQTPVMGSSYYLTCITGNVLNIKLPSALNAIKVANIKPGTEAADAVIGVAVAITSLVTMSMIAIAVLLMMPLKPLLTSPAIQTAGHYVLPALMGCLILSVMSSNVGGGVVIHGKIKTLIVPVVLAILLFFVIIPDLYENYEGFVAVGLLIITYYVSKWMYKKGIVKVDMPDHDVFDELKADDVGGEISGNRADR